MAEKKPTNREQIKQIVAGIEDSIQELFQSERYLDYLRTMSRFHTYSFNNTILIHMQMPSATRVAGFNKWKNQFGRHVKKGEKGLTIIAPTPFKKKIEEMKLDPDTRAPVLDEDGNAIMEEREIEIPLFRPVKVFDVSQTEGAPLPSLVSNLTGDVQQYEAFMEALRRSSPVPVQFKPLREGLDGFLSPQDQTITIREGMSQVQTVCAAVHEITHAILHNWERDQATAAAGNTDNEPPKPKDKNTREVEAESVSYTVCQYYGIETGANSLGYIATWSKDKTLPELKASLETITKTANILITSIDRHFAEVCKERGIDLTAQQPEQAATEAPQPLPELPDTPERFIGDMLDLMDRLYAAWQIDKNFPPENREQLKVKLARDLGTNPAMFRAVLDKFIREGTGAAEAGELLSRLDKLAQGPDQKHDYAVEYEDSIHQFALSVYQKGSTSYGMAIFAGDEATCNGLLGKLRAGTLRYDDFRTVQKAVVSRYITKDGAQLVAFTDENDKVYLGKRENYDHWGHYLNHDHSLLHISDNWKMFNFISEGGYSVSQDILVAQGALCQEDFDEFDALRVGVLAQFEQVEPMLFAGEPFHSIQPEQEQPAPVVRTEALYLLDDTTYLHIQASGGEWDYTLYDKASQRDLDGGVMDGADIDIARQRILRFHSLNPAKVEDAPLEMVDILRDAADQATQTAAEAVREQHEARMDELREHFAQEDAALWDTKLDEYPVPDGSLTLDGLIEDSGLLPLPREQAVILLEQDMTVYMVEAGKDPAMVFEPDDIMELPEGMMLAVPREEWEASPAFHQLIMDRLNHQEEREQAFLDHGADCFAIYQLKGGDGTRDIRHEGLEWLKSIGRNVERENYELAYTAPLPSASSVQDALELLWEQFNTDLPKDYLRPSMSVSDIIAVKQDGVVSFHYCDSVGFVEVQDFLTPRPTVAELEAQAKAGQTISLTDLADAVHREKGQKKSVVAQLKSQPQPERKKTAPKKSAGKEI